MTKKKLQKLFCTANMLDKKIKRGRATGGKGDKTERNMIEVEIYIERVRPYCISNFLCINALKT